MNETELRTYRQTLEQRGMDKLLKDLREKGFSKIGSIDILVQLGVCRLNEAKTIVHENAAWADRRDEDDRFHDEIEREIEDLE
jgi:hypothetical protein